MEWVDVKDRLPKEDTVCIVANLRWDGCLIATYLTCYNGFSWYNPLIHEAICLDATHWMPLPEPPQEKENEKKRN